MSKDEFVALLKEKLLATIGQKKRGRSKGEYPTEALWQFAEALLGGDAADAGDLDATQEIWERIMAGDAPEDAGEE